jgi:hypothetical protein
MELCDQPQALAALTLEIATDANSIKDWLGARAGFDVL